MLFPTPITMLLGAFTMASALPAPEAIAEASTSLVRSAAPAEGMSARDSGVVRVPSCGFGLTSGKTVRSDYLRASSSEELV